MSQIAFQQALSKLVTDPTYGRAVEGDSGLLTKDFDLSQSEIDVMDFRLSGGPGRRCRG